MHVSPELCNLIQLPRAMTPPVVSFSSPPTGGKGYRCFNKRLHKLVDCIDLKVDEGVTEREVSNIEPTIEDISEMKDEQVEELDGEETPRQEESGQQSASNPSSIITQKNHPESRIIGEKD
jgi:hypothetical protein